VVTGPGARELVSDFRSELFADAVVLYGRGLLPSPDKQDMVAYRLIAYETSRLDPLSRVRLSRFLFGYSTTVHRKRKTYHYRRGGALSRAGGFRVDLSVFLCPADRSGEILKFLRESGAGYTDRLVFFDRFQDAPRSVLANEAQVRP
jgi:hypothetical protein